MGGFIWNKKDDQKLKDLYENTSISDLENILQRTKSSIYQRARKLNLSKPENSGRFKKGVSQINSGSFKKGQTPFNKGLKQTEWLSKKGLEKVSKTKFKQGHTPHNNRPIGSERIQKDCYVYVKVAEPKTWRLKHHVIWERATGEKVDTKKNIISFKNNDSTDIRIENLECIDRKTGMKRNTIHRFPDELKLTIRILSKLNKTIQNAE